MLAFFLGATKATPQQKHRWKAWAGASARSRIASRLLSTDFEPSISSCPFFFFSLFAPGVEGGVVGACLSAAECRRNPIVPNPPRAFTTGLEWTCVCTYVCMDLCVCRAPEVEPKSCPGADRRTAGWMGDAPIRIGTPENAKPKDRLLRQIQS